jgi:hypothetical protein
VAVVSYLKDINTIARAIVAGAPFSDPPEWEDWPALGADDWDRVTSEVRLLAENFRPPQVDVYNAYRRLEMRASTED